MVGMMFCRPPLENDSEYKVRACRLIFEALLPFDYAMGPASRQENEGLGGRGPARLKELRKGLAQIEREIANYTQAVAHGVFASPGDGFSQG